MISKRTSLTILLVLLAGVAILLLGPCGKAQAQTAPTFVANSPGTGKFLTIDTDSTGVATDGTPDTMPGLWLLGVEAGSSGVTFSCWGYTPSNTTWAKLTPLFGPAAADTAVTLGAGVRATYRFPGVRCFAVVVSAGDGNFQGE